MDPESNLDDSISDTATSLKSPTTEDALDDFFDAVPWHGNTYLILEKATGRAITLTGQNIVLQTMAEDPEAQNKWACVESNGYFGFQESRSGRYLGHDGNSSMCGTATKLEAWQLITPRKHPGGSYQLLVPHWWHTLRLITVAEDGDGLVVRQHGTTLWQFVKVPDR